MRTSLLAMAVAIGLGLGPATASAQTLTKLDGPDGCVADPASSLPDGTCAEAKGIDDATDVAVSPDGRFLYAAATSSNSIAVFQRDEDTGKLTQLGGNQGCIAHSGSPIPGCATANGLEGPSALAMSPDGKNVYVTTFNLDTGSLPPVIQGTLLTFARDEDTGALTQNSCVAGTVPSLLTALSILPPEGCGLTMATFPGTLLGVPLGTASDVEVSPDGSSVVTSSFLAGAVVNWDRNPNNGSLTPRECFGTPRALFPTNGNLLPTLNVCNDGSLPPLDPDTGGPARGLGFPLDVEFGPDGSRLYAAALGLEQPATEIGVELVPEADEPGSIAVFDRAGNGALSQPSGEDGCIDDERDPVTGDGCGHRTGLLNPYRVNVSPDGENVYVGTLNVFPPDGLAGPGPGELSQFNADLTQLEPPCLQQVGLPSGDLEPTEGCSLASFGLILPADVAFSPDGSTAHIASLFHSVGSYGRDPDTGALSQLPPAGGCSIDPRNLLEGTELLAQVCQNAVPLNAPTSIEMSPDGKFAYVTSGGFLTGNPNFGPSLAEAGIESDDAIAILGPTPPEEEEPPEEPPPPGKDTTPPRLTVKAKKKQRAAKAIKVRVRCDEACTVKATGFAKPKVGRRGKLKAQQVKLEANERVKLRLKPKRKVARKLRKVRKGKANILVRARDAAGNESSERVRVKLKRPRLKR